MHRFLLVSKYHLRHALAPLLFLLVISTISAQQPNELCTTALPFPTIPTDGINCATVTGTFVNSFGVGGTICNGQSIARDLWYTFTVPIGYTSVVWHQSGLMFFAKQIPNSFFPHPSFKP